MPQRFFRLLATVWCGSLWTIGYIVMPTLSAILDDRQLAGSITSRLFHAEAWIGLATGCLLLLAAMTLVRRDEAGHRRLHWLVLAMLLRVLVGYFGLQPFAASLHEQAGTLDVAVEDSPYHVQFGMLRGVSDVFYLVQGLFGLALIWKATGIRQAT